MNLPDGTFAGAEKILDVGGWFKPEPRATHVVDLMPWETRGTTLTLAPLPGERFTPDTWRQANFLRADFSLPFADQSFDLVLCGHTLEDLAAPARLLDEMRRVGRRGVFECPSRLAEQTIGIRDRQSGRPGHPHHHWIAEAGEGCLSLYAKAASALDEAAALVPLAYTERLTSQRPELAVTTLAWEGGFTYRLVHGEEARRRARQFVAALGVPAADRMADRLLRFARRLRSRIGGRPAESLQWWTNIVELSRPYSRIPLD